MAAHTNNPVQFTYTDANASSSGSTQKSLPHPPSISRATYIIAGITTTVYGLAELPSGVKDVAVLWLLHPRLQTQECMAPFAAHFITMWNKRASQIRKGLIAVGFNQRNHGDRQVSAIANEAWRSGNETHAQDMFSSYHGTAVDASLLLDYLAAYTFPANDRKIVQSLVMGISLGGHAVWHCIMQDPRMSVGIVVIGCPDYERLMSDRARLSRRRTWKDSDGRDFVGSADFPVALSEAVTRYDPAGLLFSQLDERKRKQAHLVEELGPEEEARLIPVMAKTLGSKRILNLSGKEDKLVPYAMSKPFLDWLKKAIGKGGFFGSS